MTLGTSPSNLVPPIISLHLLKVPSLSLQSLHTENAGKHILLVKLPDMSYSQYNHDVLKNCRKNRPSATKVFQSALATAGKGSGLGCARFGANEGRHRFSVVVVRRHRGRRSWSDETFPLLNGPWPLRRQSSALSCGEIERKKRLN